MKSYYKPIGNMNIWRCEIIHWFTMDWLLKDVTVFYRTLFMVAKIQNFNRKPIKSVIIHGKRLLCESRSQWLSSWKWLTEFKKLVAKWCSSYWYDDATECKQKKWIIFQTWYGVYSHCIGLIEKYLNVVPAEEA